MIGRIVFGADPNAAHERREAFVRGARAAAPALMPTAIWGLVAGVAMIKTGLTTWQALAMTLLVYSGSAQMASLPLIAAGAPVWIALLTAGVVNLRFVIFSATLWPYFGRLPLGKRLLLGYLTADVGLAIFIARYANVPVEQRGNVEQRWFFLGIVAATWLSWQPMSILGILLAGAIPGHWGLEFAAILALIAITTPMFQGRPAVAGCLTAGVVAVIAAALPLKVGLLLAVIAGVAVAMATDMRADHVRKGGAA
jgi:predicted branched-subunit amino acid permease